MCTPVTVKEIYTIGTETPGPTFQVPWEITSEWSSVEVLQDADGESGFVQKVEDTHFTFDPDTGLVTFIAPYDTFTDGGLVILQRCTQRSRRTTIQDTGLVVGRVLNADENQAFSCIQEIEAGLYDAMKKEPGGRWWDAEGLEVQNGSPATLGSSLVTLSQVQNLILGVETAIVDNSTVLTYVGDGAETLFELTGFKNLTRGQCYLTVKAVPQSARPTSPIYNVINPADGDYPGGGSGFSYLQFTTAPSIDAPIEVRIFSGTVATSIQNGAVDTENIVDQAVTLAKMFGDAGADGRVLFVDADGEVTAVLPTTSDLDDFDSAVRSVPLNEMATPDDTLSMGGLSITNLLAGTAVTDAANVGQVAAAILASVQNKQATCTTEVAMLTALESQASDIEIGFVPDVFVLCAQYVTSPARDSFWVCLFDSSGTARRLGGSGTSNEAGVDASPVILFQRVGVSNTRIRMTLKAAEGLPPEWGAATYLALKFG